MGMFDYFRSSYDLGEQFTDITLQTKTMDDFGGAMLFFWLSPSGQLYYVDKKHVADYVEIKEDDPRYNEKHKFFNFEWVPNGNHGKVIPYITTRYVEVYFQQWDGEYELWPRLKLHIKRGILQDYEDITGKRTL